MACYLSALLAAGTILIAAVHSWTLALGVFWFGASFMMLVLVMASFNADISARLGKGKDHHDEAPTPGATQ